MSFDRNKDYIVNILKDSGLDIYYALEIQKFLDRFQNNNVAAPAEVWDHSGNIFEIRWNPLRRIFRIEDEIQVYTDLPVNLTWDEMRLIVDHVISKEKSDRS